MRRIGFKRAWVNILLFRLKTQKGEVGDTNRGHEQLKSDSWDAHMIFDTLMHTVLSSLSYTSSMRRKFWHILDIDVNKMFCTCRILELNKYKYKTMRRKFWLILDIDLLLFKESKLHKTIPSDCLTTEVCSNSYSIMIF